MFRRVALTCGCTRGPPGRLPLVPGTRWPEPAGFLPREVLKFIQLISERPLAGMEVVECSPPYDTAEITALIAARVICDMLGCQVRAGHLPRH